MPEERTVPEKQTVLVEQTALKEQTLPQNEGGLENFSLMDKYLKQEGRIALTGVQALVRIPMDQYRRDREAGLRIGTYISGYQGSPLGELDKQFRLAGPLLDQHHIRFEAGINEDVAATAVYGSQLIDLFPHQNYDAVMGIWYGKGPGVDRSGDAFRHGQFLGTSKNGGGLMLCGDDPAAKSSTIPSDSTMALYDGFFPILYPANPQDVLEFGLHGLAMSRYSGLFSALKIVTNVADGGAIFDIHPDFARPVIPNLEIGGKPFEKVQDPRLIPPYTIEMERQIYYERLRAALAYARANGLDRITVRSSSDRLGLVSAGKSYDDMMLALSLLGFGEEELRQAGIRVYKLGLIAPIEPEGAREFAQGLEDILVVEEKRGFIEMQLRDLLYNQATRPGIYGKCDPRGQPLFPMQAEMQPDEVARHLAGYLAERLNRPDLLERIKWLVDIQEREYEEVMPRTPFFCSGCPHNTSTTLPDGDLTGGGIGCHAMAAYMDRGVTWLTHMGGEGAPWMGLHHFIDRDHIFQNVGDGTYFHSASKSLEACIAAGVNMTFKILYNSAVAMTGGQEVKGVLDPISLARQLEAEGVVKVVIVPELMENYRQARLSKRITVRPKAEYNQVMQELRVVTGVTVIIFDQQCAAEKRRHRKRGTLETPNVRVHINEGVCEGCGDCGVKSNCLSVIPVHTEYGRKTQIHASSCNMDYSCLNGDCPSFMTAELAPGTEVRKKQGAAAAMESMEQALPEPNLKVSSSEPYKVLMVGIGGSGVVTVDALLITAAVVEGKYALHLDQTGLAQKGGAVLSNLIISDTPISRPNKLTVGEADVLLAFDLLASVSADNMHRYHPERTVAVVNTHRTSTAAVVTDIRSEFPAEKKLLDRLHQYVNSEGTVAVDAEELTEALFGNNQSNNIFLIGVAYQAGLLPLGAESIETALRTNGVAVEQNLKAFRWGRKYQLDPESVREMIAGPAPESSPRDEALARLQRYAPGEVGTLETLAQTFPGPESLAERLYPRVADLILYQGAAYARRYLELVGRVTDAENQNAPGRTELGEAVARWLFKLMAYKDEYEVARLWLQNPAREQVRAFYDGPLKLYIHLHPPLLRALGLKRKLRIGSWIMPVFRLLYAMRRLRGTPLDLFGRAHIRREERRLIGWYEELVEGLLPRLTPANHAQAVSIANAPDNIRGYETVKERMIAEVEDHVTTLLESYNQEQPSQKAG